MPPTVSASDTVSALGPIDPTSVYQEDGEKEKAAPWVIRKLVGGGFAAVASPVMGPVSDLVVSSFGDTILVELGLHAGFDVTTKVANDLLLEHPLKHVIPIHSSRLETTHVKVVVITLKFKATMEDAKLGFYRSSVHKIGETLLNESASVVTLCASQSPPPAPNNTPSQPISSPDVHSRFSFDTVKENLKLPALTNHFIRLRTPSPSRADVKDPATTGTTSTGSEPSPALTPLPPPPKPRRMVILILGIKPHRKLWTTSARPEESVIQYILLNGCPAVVVPVKVGAPLVAWDAMTLEKIWDTDLPPDNIDPNGEPPKSKDGKFEGMVDVLCEFLELCIDWERVTVAVNGEGATSSSGTEPEAALTEAGKKRAVRSAVTLLVAGAVRSRDSKEARKELVPERSGIAMWRIP
ncbi:hypothetical protein VNI00_012664 [Paramarasmius palmivorus]|uniref:Uncharacterized protein n=1 Tax=Paramarasmius palmivorus TaxID=297713 RepID=A0AAW0C7I2_9AGAR